MTTPHNNLPPESQPWARSIEAQLRGLQTTQTTHESRTGNTAAGLQGTLRRIAEQIRGLEEVTQGLVEVTNTLTAQQAVLAGEIARINSLVAGQVSFGIAPTATSSGWATSSSMTTRASSSIGVPGGYSQALVFALASMHFMDTSPNGGWVRAVIAGDAGQEMGGLANLSLGQSSSHTRVMAVSGGAISLECQVQSSAGTGGMSGRIAQVSGFALFFR